MFGFSRRSDYALVALAHLAGVPEPGSAASDPERVEGPVSARQVAEAYGLPVPQIMTLLKQLHRAGLVDSKRGASGGYQLARPADQINTLEVLEAVEGPVRMAQCCGEEELARVNELPIAGAVDQGEACVACRLEVRCPITQAVRQLNGRVLDLLQQTTLQDLINSADPAPAVTLTASEEAGR